MGRCSRVFSRLRRYVAGLFIIINEYVLKRGGGGVASFSERTEKIFQKSPPTPGKLNTFLYTHTHTNVGVLRKCRWLARKSDRAYDGVGYRRLRNTKYDATFVGRSTNHSSRTKNKSFAGPVCSGSETPRVCMYIVARLLFERQTNERGGYTVCVCV